MIDAKTGEAIDVTAIADNPHKPNVCRVDPVQAAEAARRKAEHERFFARRAIFETWDAICKQEIYRDTDPDMLPNKPASARVLAWEYGQRGLILTGPTRRGKTRTAWLLMRRLYDAGKSIRAFDGIGWFFEVGKAFRDMDGAERWLNALTRVDVLFLDDVFRGRLTDAQELALWGVIERRTANRKPIIITANATGDSLRADHGHAVEPIVARLREFCDGVAF
jgi:DNA replication protein DnaC